MEKLLESLARRACGAPRRVFMFTAVVGAALLASMATLNFESDFEAMVPTPSGRVLERIERAFGASGQAFLIIESSADGRATELVDFAGIIAETLSDSELIDTVDFGGERAHRRLVDTLLPYGPRFLPPERLDELDGFLSSTDLDDRLGRQLARLSLPGSGEAEEQVARDPLDLGSPLFARLQSFRGAFRFDPSSPHYLSSDGRALLVRLRGRARLDAMTEVGNTVLAIESAIEDARRRLPDLDVVVDAGGGYFLAHESATVVRTDLIFSLSTSMILVVLLMAWTLRGLGAALLAMPPLLLGLLCGLGLHGLFHARLMMISLGSAAILIGLGVDFSIHLLLRGRSEHRDKVSGSEAMVSALRQIGPGLVFAALTTMAAFLAFLLSDFSFLMDMGSITAFGILGTLAASLLVLPPLAGRWLESGSRTSIQPRTLGVDWLVSRCLRAPRAIIAIAGVGTVACVIALVIEPPEFETDLRNIHARDSRALLADQRLADIFGGSREPLLLLLEADSEDDLEVLLRQASDPLDALVARGLLKAHVSAAHLLPDRRVEGKLLADCRDVQPRELEEAINAALERAGFEAASLEAPINAVVAATLDREPLGLRRLGDLGLDALLGELVRRDPGAEQKHLALVTLFPAASLWSEEARQDTVKAVTGALDTVGVQGQLAGLFTVSAESAQLVATELWKIGLLAFCGAALAVAILFRGVARTCLVLLPVTLSCIWTAALFKLMGHSIHFMNVAVMPMIVGIGIDDGIHILHRFNALIRKRGESHAARDGAAVVTEALSVTGTGIALTSLTTMVAFGSLALSRNRGIASLGALCLIGIAAAFIAAVTVLPSVLSLLADRKRN